MFAWRPIGNNTWPFLRNHQILSACFCDKLVSKLIQNVFVIPGHVAVVFENVSSTNRPKGSILCLFDAFTPKNGSPIEEEDLASFIQFLKTGVSSIKNNGSTNNSAPLASPRANREVLAPSPPSAFNRFTNVFNSIAINTKQDNSNPISQSASPPASFILPVSGFPSLVLYNGELRILKILFERNNEQKLRMYVVTMEGKLIVWEWMTYNIVPNNSNNSSKKSNSYQNLVNQISGTNYQTNMISDWKWEVISQFTFASVNVTSGTSIVRDLAYSSQYKALMWWESDDKFYSRKLTITESNNNNNKNPKINIGNNNNNNNNNIQTIQQQATIDFGPLTLIDSIPNSNIRSFEVGKDGVWLVSSYATYFWSFRSLLLYSVELDSLISSAISNSSSIRSSNINSNNHGSTSNNHGSNINYQTSIIAAIVHPITKELVLILHDRSTNHVAKPSIYVCNIIADKVNLHYLCTLDLPISSNANDSFLNTSSTAGYSPLHSLFIPVNENSSSTTTTTTISPSSGYLFFFHFHTIVCIDVQRSNCSYFDIKSGKLIEECNFPVLSYSPPKGASAIYLCVWNSQLGGATGCWSKIIGGEGNSSKDIESKYGESTLWELRITSVVKQIQRIASFPEISFKDENKKEKKEEKGNINYSKRAIQLSKDWGLSKLEITYLLQMISKYWGITLHEEEEIEEFKRKISENLLLFSENPAIPFVFLSNIYSNQFIHHSISTFLHKRSPSSQKDLQIMDRYSDRSAIRNSYHYFTPLNNQLSPLLSSYLDISSSRRSMRIPSIDSKSPRRVEEYSLSFENLISPSVTRTELDRIARKYPSQLLSTLQNAFFDISEESSTPSSLNASNLQYLSNRFPFFEILCHLYFTWNPSFLPKYINICANSPLFTRSSSSSSSSLRSSPSSNDSQFIDSQEGSSHLRRCFLRVIRALPPITLKNVETHFQLLFDLDMKPNAVQTLLSFNKWDKAVHTLQILSEECSKLSISGENEALSIKKQQQVEIFHLLLEYCLKRKSYERCVEIWKFTPSSFEPMNLFRMLLLYKPQNEKEREIVTSGNDKIGNFIGVLKVLIEKQKVLQKE